MSEPARFGSEVPRLFTEPLRELTPLSSAGFSLVAFAEEVLGLQLLPWQRWLAVHALELNREGGFRFRTVVVLIARQNGKTTFAQVLALWRMFVDRAPLVLGTAQSLDIAEECWAGAVEMAEGTPELAVDLAGVDMAAGKKTLRTKFGSRYKVQSANRRGGRGLSGDLVMLDELREHRSWDAWGAVTKTTMARPDPQVVCLSNAGDDASVVLNHLRAAALAPDADPSLGLFEWSAPDGCDLWDRDGWAQANPSLGFKIPEAAIESSLATDPPHVFRTEVLCQRVALGADSPLPRWDSCGDAHSQVEPGWPVAFAVDVSWDRGMCWVGAALRRPDGRYHLEVVAQGRGSDWVGDWLSERVAEWDPVAVCWQQTGAPVSSLGEVLEDVLGSAICRPMSGPDMAKAAGLLFDLTGQGAVVHPAQPQLDGAAAVAAVRPVGDAWAFDRKKSQVDVAPLTAVSLALWAIASWKQPKRKTAPKRLR